MLDIKNSGCTLARQMRADKVSKPYIGPEQKNLIGEMECAAANICGAPDEPRFYFIAIFIREYEQLQDALTGMRPDNSNYLRKILKFHAEPSEVQKRLKLCLATFSENSNARSRSAPCR